MLNTAARIADFLTQQSFVKVVTHIDADGLTSGAIASLALDRAGIEHEVEFIKQLDDAKVQELRSFDGALWFTDLGSGKLDAFDPQRTVVTDHHIPQTTKPRTKEVIRDPVAQMGIPGKDPDSLQRPHLKVPAPSGQMNLFDFSPPPHHASHSLPQSPSISPASITSATSTFIPSHDSPTPEEFPISSDAPYHLNPHLFGHSGANDISGAGVTYLVARALDKGNTDLAQLAIVGAVGDLQDAANCRLIGLNRDILDDGIRQGVVRMDFDIRYFGKETRPIHKLLQYSSDPIVPSVSGSEGGALEFLMEMGIELKQGDGFRRWVDLERDERKTIISGMVKLALTMGLGTEDVRRMIGEVYSLPLEESGTPMHDSKEFATMLNACGKNLNPEIGFRVCKGDRGEYLERAYHLLQGHRRNLAQFIQLVLKDLGIQQRRIIQFFDAGTQIPENLVGIVAGMVLNSGDSDISKVMLGLAKAEHGYKISARTTRNLVNTGINLAEALQVSSQEVGGEGGGHNIAAGASVPDGAVEEFLELLEKALLKQIVS